MQLIPQLVTVITHPLINNAYLKKEFSSDKGREDVLVLETNLNSDQEHDAFDSYVASFMNDLHDLRLQAEQQVGHFDRIDIRA